MNHCRSPPFRCVCVGGGGGKKVREYIHETNWINPKAEDNLTSGQDIIQRAELSSVEPLDLLGYTFVHYHDETKQRAEVKEFLEDESEFMV